MPSLSLTSLVSVLLFASVQKLQLVSAKPHESIGPSTASASGSYDVPSFSSKMRELSFEERLNSTEVPYHQVSFYWAESNLNFCSGAIYNEWFIITASSCLVDVIDPSQFYVMAGAPQPDYNDDDGNSICDSNTQQQVYASAVWEHPDYDALLGVNDIGVVELSYPLEFNEAVKPIRVISKPANKEKIAHVTTWAGGIAYMTEVTVSPDRNCYPVYPGFNENSMICAIKTNFYEECPEESGSPLVCTDNKGRAYLCGIFTGNPLCASRQTPMIFTAVNSFFDWFALIDNFGRRKSAGPC